MSSKFLWFKKFKEVLGGLFQKCLLAPKILSFRPASLLYFSLI